MQLEQEDLLKSLFPIKLSNLQLSNESKDFFIYNKQKTNNNEQLYLNNQEQVAFQKIFPLSDDNDINEDSLITHKLYEITNSTDFKIKFNNSIKNTSKTKKKFSHSKKSVEKWVGRSIVKHSYIMLRQITINSEKIT